MSAADAVLSGGCQCGAVRFRASGFSRASLCHCRMCQKAFGNYFAPLVVAETVEWTRGERKLFASSNISNRGFCGDCGTPLTLEDEGNIELSIAAFDDPQALRPQYHSNVDDGLDVTLGLHNLPDASPEKKRENDAWNAKIVSRQHPDHDTPNGEWPR